MIEVKNLSKYYYHNQEKICIFKDVSFQIYGKQSLALIGGNGAGKSTLLRLLSGVDLPDSGEIITNSSISWPIGSRDGFHPLMSARQNVLFTCRLFLGKNKKEINKKVLFIEQFADIGDFFDRPFKFYSAGMKARVAFALSMAFDFDFYLIDEMTSAGDISFRERSAILMEQKLKNSNFIMVDHNLKSLLKYCDKALLIKDNSIKLYNNINEAIKLHKQSFGRYQK